MFTATLCSRFNATFILLGAVLALSGIGRSALAQEVASDSELESLIQTQLRQLSSNELETRRKACKELSTLCEQYDARAKSCVPALINCLADEDAEIAESSVSGLQNCGEAAVKPLIESLVSDKPLVRKHAATTLQRIAWLKREVKIDQALVPLRKLLGDADAGVREEAVTALGQMGDADPTTLDRLKTLLQSATTTDRTAALRAIVLLGEQEKATESVQAFKDLIVRSLADDDADVRWMALYALEFSGLVPTDVLPLLLKALDDPAVDVRRVAISEIQSLPKEVDRSVATPKLIQLLATDEDNLAAVCELLGAIGPMAKEAVPGLKKALQSLEVSVVTNAADALWKIDQQTTDSIPALERFLQRGNLTDGERICDTISTIGPAAAPLTKYVVKLLKSGDWDVQWSAADALGAIVPSDPETIAVLVDFLGHDSGLVAGSSAAALAKIGLKAVPTLIEATKAGSTRQREFAADALGRIGPPAKDAIEPLKKLLKSEHRGSRVWSAIALGKIEGSAEMVPVLIEALLEDESFSVRQQAAVALGQIGGKAKAAIPALRAALKEKDEALQQAADKALAIIEM